MTPKKRLIELYSNKSKHSNYQILPRRLNSLLKAVDVQTSTRYERERLDYILRNLDPSGKTVLDIGGNTGFFSFELLDAGARSVHCYEGNKQHAEFVGLAAQALNIEDKIKITNDYFSFSGSEKEQYDVVLLLNVLHHVGDDYGDKEIVIEKAKELIIQQLNSVAGWAKTVVFQLGFNWHGDRNKPLFQNGTKREVIELITGRTKEFWEVEHIGVAERQTEGRITYQDLSDNNIERDDSLGEFLNRPIFILKSKAD